MSAFCQYIRSHHRLRHPAISAGSDGLFEEQWCLSHDAFLFRGAKVMRIFRSSKTLQELQTSQSNASSGNYSRANIFDHRIRYWLFRIDISHLQSYVKRIVHSNNLIRSSSVNKSYHSSTNLLTVPERRCEPLRQASNKYSISYMSRLTHFMSLIF